MHSLLLSRHTPSNSFFQIGQATATFITASRKCQIHYDGRQRLSNFWTPTGGSGKKVDIEEDSHSLLIRGGFIRQTHAGIFHFLPLGLRVQEKVEKLLEKHMSSLGASKVSLSTFSSESIWQRSGRLSGDRSELFHLEDRKGSKFLLSPTHEEEITSVIANDVHSYKDLPLRLYQITRKYRDEPRPRQGLLRTREFLMKDLYTFDLTKSAALQTYKTVRDAYSAFFDDLKVPYLTAEADSGSIGGDLSHEYHIANHKGEDNVISCSSCSYVANEEVVYPRVQSSDDEIDSVQATFSAMASEVDPILQNLTPFLAQSQFAIWTCLSRDRETKYVAVFPSQVSSGNERFARDAKINIRVMKRICKDIDLTSANETLQTGSKTHPLKEIYVFDYRVSLEAMSSLRRAYTGSSWPRKGDVKFFPLEDLVEIEEGDCCPKCGSGTVKVQPSVELGHTFYLGTKYSRLLEAEVLGRHSVAADFCNATSTTSDPTQVPESPPSQELASTKSYIEMGCHGIGVSRLIAAIADHLTDSKGLNWPRVIAPFEAVIIPAPGFEEDAELILDQLSTPRLQHSDLAPEDRANLLQEITPGFDVILDDRPKVMAWKLRDADLIGYPVIVVLGRAWPHERKCEVQCRRLDGYKRMVPLEELRETIQGLLARL